MKWTVRIGIGIAALAILAVIGSALFAVYYEEDIKQYAIGELNKNLKTELKVNRVEMHVFAKFPFISLRFKNIWATDPFDKDGSDSLFYFNAGWLKFNLFDVLRNDYRIRRIELEEGFANLKINNKGEANFDIIKRDDEKSGFLLRLNQCKVRQARVRFTNEMNNDNLDLLADEIAFSGDFSREVFTTRVESEMLVNTLDLHGIQYLQARSLEISAKLNVNKKEKSWKIGNGKASVDHSMPFSISGTFSDRGDKIKLTLDIDSRELQLTPALDLLPDKLKPDMGKYGSDGIIDFKCRISGYAGKSATPLISASFHMKNGTLTHLESRNKLENVELSGTYTNGREHNKSTGSFEISEMHAIFGSGSFRAHCKVSDLNTPKVEAGLDGDFSVAELLSFTGYDSILTATGHLSVNTVYSGKVENLADIGPQDILGGTLSGTLQFDSLSFRYHNSRLKWTSCSATLKLHNRDVLIESMAGKVANSDFNMKGLFRNAVPYLSEEGEILTVEAALKSSRIDLDSLLAGREGKEEARYTLAFPADIHINFRVDADSLNFRRFRCGSLRGIIHLDESGLNAEPIQFNAMEGSVDGICTLSPLPDGRFRLATRAVIQGIDVTRLFFQFENFRQEVITSKHLKGKTNATVFYSSPISPELKVPPAEVKVSADIEIYKGELIHFHPLKEISDYFRSNKILNALVKPDELEKKMEHIYFSRLSNHIEISKRIITIPDMKIRSSALNLEVAGTHTFDNEVNYELNFYFTDLLIRKNRPANEHFGYVRDDGLGKTRVFLRMTGLIDDPDIRLDKKGMLSNIKEKNREEKRQLKGLLNEEFGWFEHDTDKVKPVEKKEDPGFLIEWDEMKEDDADSGSADTASAGKKPDMLQWLRKMEKKKGDEKQDDLNFEDDDY